MIEIKGKFTRDYNKASKSDGLVSGTIEINNGVVKLQLYDVPEKVIGENTFWEETSFWGIDIYGRPLSLFRSRQVKEISGSGGKYLEFICTTLLVNILISKTDTPFFNSCSLRMHGINAWFNDYYGKVNISEESDDISFNYKKANPAKFIINSDIEIELRPSYTCRFQPFELVDKTYFNISSKANISLETFLQLGIHYSFLFSILFDKTSQILSLDLYSDEHHEYYNNEVKKKIEVYGYSINNDKIDERVIRNFPITYINLKNHLTEVFRNYHTLFEQTETLSIEALTYSIFNRNFLNIKTEIFLSLFRAVEAMANDNYSSEDRAAFTKRLEAILKMIPNSEDRHWIQSSMSQFNRKSLRSKMIDTLTQHIDLLKLLKIDIPNVKGITKTLTIYRNKLVHPDHNIQLDSQLLRELSYLLKILLTALLFKKLCIPASIIHEYTWRISYNELFYKMKSL